MSGRIALIGFGEAGRTFAGAAGWRSDARAFDLKAIEPQTAGPIRAAYTETGVTGCESLADALAGAEMILSLVTADQTEAAAAAAARHLPPGALFFDMNSVSPGAKQRNAAAIEQAGGRYVDVAVMSPVQPAAMTVPLLISGPHAAQGEAALHAIGFSKVAIAGDQVGGASATKMVRSVMIKGIEALTAEMILAARRAGVTENVLGSLGGDWPEKIDYNLDRMLAHGTRRAAEMDEVVVTLTELGIEPAMTRGTVTRQRAMGALLGSVEMPQGLEAKLAFLDAMHPEMIAKPVSAAQPKITETEKSGR
ncbi:3-hydroxyisobutyrate dehydrogenase-like beta-hydroxyacid dehydrogenase [Sphingobium sp. B7D2B]|uniref:NAD(P)-dependent oxidoreductase n=1 Tax=Sphingobium sp. B7D2B TaxID=2940583 RepID=UPI00222404A1|nr:NAD(P)-dependent oxidoreductase [Sphingobium sp. B7D2B]MCW2366395.1 3-hydroxyisobutyrate dehydrogenase-like beta-hydroxyacid dehydrogenase [Sphingobium sp. B7D2B]